MITISIQDNSKFVNVCFNEKIDEHLMTNAEYVIILSIYQIKNRLL